MSERAQRLTESQRKARRDRAEALEAQRERKRDARRKIVLGGKVLALAREHPQMAEWLQKLLKSLPDRDRALFDGFKVSDNS